MNSSKITLNSCYTPGVYAATKAGLEAGSDALRVELASEEVSFLFICYMVSLFILEIASFQIHVVLLDPGYIIKHTPLASRSTISPTYSFHFGVEMI